jgi:trehalose 6-phosphate synthase/phosphatase
MNRKPAGIVLVSNRLPMSFEFEGKELHSSRSSGGLITALEPLLKEHGGVWVGSAGTRRDPRIMEHLADDSRNDAHRYEPVFLTPDEQLNFYEGLSNEVVWPLFHDLQSRCNFNPTYWKFYQLVNQKFADAVTKVAQANDVIWINDYQLMQVGASLRAGGCKSRLAFFLHIPFPPPDIFAKLPWRRTILEGLLEHDLLGLQTLRDQRNLLACLRSYLPGVQIGPKGSNEARKVTYRSRQTLVRFFPISIDYQDFSSAASSREVEEKLRELRRQTDHTYIILGVDRLDYTKGIPERLRAYSTFLRQYPDMCGKTTFVQIVVPSRETIPGYRRLKHEIEQTVASINGEFAQPGWVPINYIHRAVPRPELIALYRCAHVALITPLKDGMNLVSKEYCASRIGDDGVLILSEFAGAAAEFGNRAILVNPYDQEGVAVALKRALTMPEFEQRHRMIRIREQIRQSDIHRWLEDFMSELTPDLQFAKKSG